jgi:hypothetical protein
LNGRIAELIARLRSIGKVFNNTFDARSVRLRARGVARYLLKLLHKCTDFQPLRQQFSGFYLTVEFANRMSLDRWIAFLEPAATVAKRKNGLIAPGRARCAGRVFRSRPPSNPPAGGQNRTGR